MTIAQKRANKEVLVILEKLNLTNKIPENVLKNIKENQDEMWNFTYDDSIELEDQKIQRQTAILFSTLYIMYICENEKEKKELKQIYEENEQKINQNNDFEVLMNSIREEKKEESMKQDEKVTNLPLTLEKDNSLFKRIKNWLRSILKK